MTKYCGSSVTSKSATLFSGPGFSSLYLILGTACLLVQRKSHTRVTHVHTFSVSEQICIRNIGVPPVPFGEKKWMNFGNKLSFVLQSDWRYLLAGKEIVLHWDAH